MSLVERVKKVLQANKENKGNKVNKEADYQDLAVGRDQKDIQESRLLHPLWWTEKMVTKEPRELKVTEVKQIN